MKTLITIVYKRPYGKNQEGFFIGTNGLEIKGATYGAITQEGKGITFNSYKTDYEVDDQVIGAKKHFNMEKAIEVDLSMEWDERTSREKLKEVFVENTE